MSTKPKSIHIFLADGDPNGVRIAQLSMSTIQAFAFRRSVLSEVRKRFPELERPGAYILVGPDEDQPGRQLAYVGESEDLGARLTYHAGNQNPRDAKTFWTDTIVLLSKDENLTKSHARYIEACLIRSGAKNVRWTMPNNKLPSENAGKLPLPDIAAMDEFIEQSKILAGALGCDLFREIVGRDAGRSPTDAAAAPASHVASPEFPTFTMSGDGYRAEMFVSPSGEFILRSGSTARRHEAPSIPKSASQLRAALVQKGVLREENGSLILESDVATPSVSAAGAIICGMSVNGRAAWKSRDGGSYGEIEANAGGVSPPSNAFS